MLETILVENLDKQNFIKRKTKKKQILLYDTQRRITPYINMLKYRLNGEYKNVPHFLIDKLGKVYKIFDSNYYSQTFNEDHDKRVIKVGIENLGWLEKNTINGILHNWIGDPYRGIPHIKVWRDHHFWDPYTDSQLDSLGYLCSELLDKHNITKQIVPSQGYLNNIRNFNGVVCKSNFSNIYTDINPSFNFEKIVNKF